VANRLRGEVALSLGGQERRLRPTFARLVAAEAEIGSLYALIDRTVTGDVRLAEIAALFWHCLDGEGADRAAFGEEMLAAGMAKLLPAYRALLSAAFASE